MEEKRDNFHYANALALAEQARQLQTEVDQIMDPAVDQPAENSPAADLARVQVSIRRTPSGNILLLFDRPVEKLGMSLAQARVMIDRLRNEINGIEPVRKKYKK